MSKMRMPEMSVVRFTESDVIVASNGLRLNKYGDGQIHNAYVTYNGHNYGNYVGGGYDYDKLYADFNADNSANFGNGTNFSWEYSAGTGSETFGAIMEHDNSTDASSCDGWYYWNGSNFTWIHQ